VVDEARKAAPLSCIHHCLGHLVLVDPAGPGGGAVQGAHI
jgi:hypothetical protein